MNFMSCNKFSIGIIDLNVILQDTSLGKTELEKIQTCLLYTSPSPRDRTRSRMPSSA